jgi:hypothetical protein
LVDEEASVLWILRRGRGVDRLPVGKERGRVKNSEPTKNVTVSQRAPTELA